MALISLACTSQSQWQQPAATRPFTQFVSPAPSPPITPTVPGQHSPSPASASSLPGVTAQSPVAATEVPPESWQQLRPGLERRRINLLSEEGGVRETLYILSFDPVMYEFEVGYKPGAPQRLTDWQREMNALVVVNGGFFTPEYRAAGLIISNGQKEGTSYAGFGGMLAITAAGPEVRSLVQQPYDPNEPLLAAIQSFPMLVTPVNQIGYPREDGLADRRTVVAQDRQGRILFIVAQTGTLTLHELSRYLADSELDLSIALNLDGGASSGIQLAEPVEGVAPFSLLPIVIAVRPRG
jgi:uncharacterized protein YigE (DUF2233 family)